MTVIINSVSYQIANVATAPYETISEYISFKSIARNMKVLRSFEDWCLFFDKICSRSDGYHRKVTDLEWSILFSAVMAVRLQVPLQCLNGEAAAVPFLISTENSVDDKVEWINKFNKSSKRFTVNTWKDCRKQTRLSQMLPEQVFEAKVREMLEWNFTDDDGHASCDPIDYNELYCSELPKDYT